MFSLGLFFHGFVGTRNKLVILVINVHRRRTLQKIRGRQRICMLDISQRRRGSRDATIRHRSGSRTLLLPLSCRTQAPHANTFDSSWGSEPFVADTPAICQIQHTQFTLVQAPQSSGVQGPVTCQTCQNSINQLLR